MSTSRKRSRSYRRSLQQAMLSANNQSPIRHGIQTNGHTKSYEQILAEEFTLNAMSMRKEWLESNLDPRRDIDDECGYPKSITPTDYKRLYDRDSISARVVQVFPRECWALQPTVYEDENSEVVTTFEQAWDTLGKNLLGVDSKFKQEEGNPIWEYFKRLDTLAGIGTFGLMLLGIDDGRPLWQAIAGFEDGLESALDKTDRDGNPVKMDPSMQETKEAKTEDGSVASIMGTDAQYYDTFQYTYGGKKKDKNKPDQMTPEQGVGNAFPTQEESTDEEGTEQEPDQQDDAASMEGAQEEPEEGFGADSEQVSEGDEQSAPEFNAEVKLLFIRCFDESLVQPVQYESDINNPRFGQPIRYLITLNDPRQQHAGVGLPLASVYVHWSRVIHFADVHWQEGSSETFAAPRMEVVINNLLNLIKIYGGDAEGFWRGCFPGLSIETHPSLGGDVVVDKAGLKDAMEQRNNGSQKDLLLMGMAAKTLPPQVVDPTTHIDVQITAICIKISVPKRVFMGSERGELASGQDDSTWNDRVKERQTNLLTPRLIVPFVDRMVKIGCLPEPEGFAVEWPDMNAASDLEKAQIAQARMTALQLYISGNVESLITPVTALSKVMEIMTEDEAKAAMEEAEMSAESRMTPDPNAMQQQQMDQQFDLDQQAIDEGLNPAGETTQIGDTHQHNYPEGSKAGESSGPPGKGGFPPSKPGQLPMPPNNKKPLEPM